ncbi:polar amino acid transport system permease protein [Glaciihabitans tibetensis]|uniref:Polar amino acid transport system permease protein n=1 Tax=Glaciihabitans tibetensis TaxID=1266600 RepID=A0A2T0V739_9MICO|nr:amino acid ABC transporter permease [Glaciihabitans tibetensis]PRY65868.1 polar amino acid transport system permease protein [Glaciihabitans tibetensis]
MSRTEERIETGTGSRPTMTVVPVRHWGQWITAAALVVVLAGFASTLVTNENYRWDVVGQYLFSSRILTGLWHTIELTAISMIAGIILGVLVAIMRESTNPVFSKIAWLYIWFFRGTPLFVQLLFWGYIAALYPNISLGIPFTDAEFWSVEMRDLMTPWLAAILGLSLNEGAYMAEIVRGGLSSIDQGQREAGQAIGMSRARILRRIILPQAMRVILPPTGNNVISMLKTTSVVSVVAFPELLYSAQLIYAVNYLTIPLLIVASIWYLLVTTTLTIGQHSLEKHFGQGHTTSARSSGGVLRNVMRLQRRGTPPEADIATEKAHG